MAIPLTSAQQDLLSESVSELGLPVRVVNALETHLNIRTIQDLLSVTATQILAVPNFGKKTLNSIMGCLAKFGFKATTGRSSDNEDLSCIEARRRNIRAALGVEAAIDFDAEILLDKVRGRRRRKSTTKLDPIVARARMQRADKNVGKKKIATSNKKNSKVSATRKKKSN
jgi:hypothetical protein